MLVQESLPLGPDSPRSVERLQLDPGEVDDFAAPDRDEAVVDAASGHIQFGDNVQFVPRLVKGQEVNAVRENLSPFEEAERADDDLCAVLARRERAGADGDL